MKEKFLNKNKSGITLIALIITIIVLLILAGVTISMITGEEGILTQVEKAKTKNIEGEEKDAIGLSYSDCKVDTLGGEVEAIKLQQSLSNMGHNVTVTKENDKLKIVFNNTKNEYTIDNKGNLAKNEPLTEADLLEILENAEDNVTIDQYGKKGNIGWWIYTITSASTVCIEDPNSSYGGNGYKGPINNDGTLAENIPYYIRINKINYKVTELGGLLDDSPYLVSLEIPSSVTIIGDQALDGCTSLKEVIIPNTVTTIGDHAFGGCSGLEKIIIPSSVTSIGDNQFNRCTSLKTIEVDDKNQAYSSIDGVLFNKEQTEIIRYPEGKNDLSYTIPNSVSSIGYGAFLGCNTLTSMILPENVTNIGKYAFHSCENLESFEIPKNVTSIGENAFMCCDKLYVFTYKGTTSDWNAINLESSWKYDFNEVTINCTDGNIIL